MNAWHSLKACRASAARLVATLCLAAHVSPVAGCMLMCSATQHPVLISNTHRTNCCMLWMDPRCASLDICQWFTVVAADWHPAFQKGTQCPPSIRLHEGQVCLVSHLSCWHLLLGCWSNCHSRLPQSVCAAAAGAPGSWPNR